MAQLKKPLEWKKVILEMTNSFCNNFLNRVQTHYSVPAGIVKYFEKTPLFKDAKQMEEFVDLLNEVKNEWKTFGTSNEVTPVYFQLVIVNACNILNSLKNNLVKEEIKGDKIEISGGIDVLASTGMQMLAAVSTELITSYQKYELTADSKDIFAHATNNLKSILNQNAQEAFAKLIDNMILFNSTYRQVQQKLADLTIEPGAEDIYEGPRTQLFIAYTNGYILISMMLTLLLTYPLENGLMPEEAYNKMVPNINLF